MTARRTATAKNRHSLGLTIIGIIPDGLLLKSLLWLISITNNYKSYTVISVKWCPALFIKDVFVLPRSLVYAESSSIRSVTGLRLIIKP